MLFASALCAWMAACFCESRRRELSEKIDHEPASNKRDRESDGHYLGEPGHDLPETRNTGQANVPRNFMWPPFDLADPSLAAAVQYAPPTPQENRVISRGRSKAVVILAELYF